jgi:pimeloyl-ACP methyl ester carboxylesterase
MLSCFLESAHGPSSSSDQDVFKVGPNFDSWREIVPRITCPTLLITADPARGAIVGPEDVSEIERTWSNGRVLHIDEAGHNIRREQYTTYIAAIKSFFNEH